MFYQTFLSPEVKRSAFISDKHDIYQFPHKLPDEFRLRILASKKKAGKTC